MSSWKYDMLNGVNKPSRHAPDGPDLSEAAVNALADVAAELFPDDPDHQVLVVTLSTLLGDSPADLRRRAAAARNKLTDEQRATAERWGLVRS